MKRFARISLILAAVAAFGCAHGKTATSLRLTELRLLGARGFWFVENTKDSEKADVFVLTDKGKSKKIGVNGAGNTEVKMAIDFLNKETGASLNYYEVIVLHPNRKRYFAKAMGYDKKCERAVGNTNLFRIGRNVFIDEDFAQNVGPLIYKFLFMDDSEAHDYMLRKTPWNNYKRLALRIMMLVDNMNGLDHRSVALRQVEVASRLNQERRISLYQVEQRSLDLLRRDLEKGKDNVTRFLQHLCPSFPPPTK